MKDAFISWLTRWQKQNADAIEELITKHGVHPPHATGQAGRRQKR